MRDFAKRNPAGAAALVLLFGALVGTFTGGAFGLYMARDHGGQQESEPSRYC